MRWEYRKQIGSAEEQVACAGAAAKKRKTAKVSLEGDKALIEAWETQKRKEMIVKLNFAKAREAKGEATLIDAKLFKSRLVKAYEKEQAAPAGAAKENAPPNPKKKATRAKETQT
jgi:hypothetical protein